MFEKADGIVDEISESDNPDTPSYPPLWHHQKVVIERAIAQGSFAGFLEMGTGKTRIGLEILQYFYMADWEALRSSDTTRALVFAPLSVVPTWAHEAERYTPEIAPEVGKLIGRNLMERQHERHKKIWVINHEYVIQPGWKELSHGVTFPVVMIDESHKIKNPKAMRTKEIIRICDES